jgi:ubiquinone/menaquinone biosynthesis C-methylase UbiE
MTDRLKRLDWNESYNRGENFIFYPKEEVIKFINRFVLKRSGVNSYFKQKDFKNTTNNSLDFGCGIGRQTILCAEMGFESYGIDVSTTAIDYGFGLLNSSYVQYRDKVHFASVEGTDLEFESGFFDFIICDSVLDSMYFDLAKSFMKEFDRVTNQYVYLSLISASCNSGNAEDSLVESIHEKNTIQSYYDLARINDLIKDTSFSIKWINEVLEKRDNSIFNSRFNIVLSK